MRGVPTVYTSADEWVLVLDNPLQIAWTETLEDEQLVNINMSLAANQKAPDDWLEEFQIQLQELLPTMYGDSMNIELMEARLLNGEPVIYTEMINQITDEALDIAIEQGIYTEAQIEAAGGREALLAIPPTTQVGIYAVKDGYCYVCTGTYYEESQKQVVLDTMAIMIDTVEKK